MKFYKIEYRYYYWEQDSGIMLVSANSPADAIEKAELQDAYEYSVHEYSSLYKLGSKAYSRYSGAYNALWLDEQGEPAFWGYYNPQNNNYYLASPGHILAKCVWDEHGFLIAAYGDYSYEDVRRILQFGILY